MKLEIHNKEIEMFKKILSELYAIRGLSKETLELSVFVDKIIINEQYSNLNPIKPLVKEYMQY